MTPLVPILVTRKCESFQRIKDKLDDRPVKKVSDGRSGQGAGPGYFIFIFLVSCAEHEKP